MILATSAVKSVTKKLLAISLFLASTLAPAAELRGTVVAVADGDTLTVLDAEKKQHKIRLAGIDAPEKHQGFADRSRQNLASLTMKKQAVLDCYKVDQFKRQVCRVRVGGKDVALAQVGAGLAWHYKRFEKEQTPTERGTYSNAEASARASRIGLWQSDNPVPPWEFRQRGTR
jgi:endonuclease YncB( thermonuclease family)